MVTYHPKPAGQVVYQPVHRFEDGVQNHIRVGEVIETEGAEQ